MTIQNLHVTRFHPNIKCVTTAFVNRMAELYSIIIVSLHSIHIRGVSMWRHLANEQLTNWPPC